MKHKKNQNQEKIGFWESTSDLLAALLLILLLVIMLLFLYFKMYPENTEVDPEWGDTYEHTEESSSGGRELRERYDSGGGGGDDEEITEDDDERDGVIRAAIHVTVIDGETSKVIPQEGLRFRLYNNQNKLQILHDYYPEKTSIKEYSTTEKGDFYLPEKIYTGNYYFKDLSTIPGYMFAVDTVFTVDRTYEWSSPLEVKIEIYPVQNRIAVRLTDFDTGDAIAGASFSIIAAEDIRSADGSVRFAVGETVGELLTNLNGFASSDELYLGKYQLLQKAVPEYYAGLSLPVEVDVVESASNYSIDEATADEETIGLEKTQGTNITNISLTKTTIVLALSDERTGEPIANVQFMVTCDREENPGEMILTDEQGTITLKNLQKNTTYHLRQQTIEENYHMLSEDVSVTVDKMGHIDGLSKYTAEVKNRKIVVAISVRDAILGKETSDLNLSLYNKENQLIKTWSTTNKKEQFDDLAPGVYYLKIGSDNKKYEITVGDTCEIQDITIKTYTTLSYILLWGGITIVMVLLVLCVIFVRRALRKSEESQKK